MSFYKFSDDHTGIRIIRVIEFDDNEHYDNFIAQVSELLWGDCGSYEDANGDTVCPREPYSVEESLARLREFSDKALAWDNMVEAHSSDSENDWVITELMDDILKEVKQ